MQENSKIFNCNMELTLDIIGGKWKSLIIFHIGNSKKLRYSEIRKKLPKISERVLSRELRELEKNKIIIREVYEEKVLRVEYSLTDVGNEVLLLLEQLQLWGAKYNKDYRYATIICSTED